MPERKTVGQLMEEMRLKAGAQNYHGHEYMDLERFAEDTRHMIIFDVLTHDSPVGWKGERTRLFLTEAVYQKSLENQEKGHIKILSHAKVRQGHLYYDRSDQLRWRSLLGTQTPPAARPGSGQTPEPIGFVDAGTLKLGGAGRLELRLDLGEGVILQLSRG